jgi:hypothetical protein
MICASWFVNVVDAWLCEIRDNGCNQIGLVITPDVWNDSRSIKVIEYCQIYMFRGRHDRGVVTDSP